MLCRERAGTVWYDETIHLSRYPAMNLPAAFFPLWVQWSTLLAALGLLGWAASRVRWRALDHVALNAWLGACVLTMAMWMMKGGFKPGLSFHLLGATILALMMGPWLALLALAIVLAGVTAYGVGDWMSLGLNFWLMAVLPVALVSGVLQLTQRLLPPNLFIYVFVCAFLAGGASLFAVGLAGIAVLGLAAAYPWDELLTEALPFYFLLSWSEAFTTGLIMAILIVYRPQWVATFDDSRYLDDKSDPGV